MRRGVAGPVLLLLAANAAFGDANTWLKISILEGEGSFNNIKRRVGRDSVVDVRNERGQPVSGAKVTFTLPAEGPGGAFAAGEKSFMTMTDSSGHASTAGFKPNMVEGRFQIKVKAVYGSREGVALISQSNTAAGGVDSGAHHSKKYLLLAIVGGGAAAGVVAATRGGHSSPAGPAPPPPTSVSVGAVAIGGPR